MSIFEPASPVVTNRVLAIFRIVAGIVFMSAGSMKLFGWPPAPQPMPAIALLSQMGIGGILEFFGGLAIVLGFCTRPVAFILSGEMAVAYFQFHFPTSPYPTVNMGMPAILYCFFYFYVAFAGPGAWSVDGIIARGRQAKLTRAIA